VSRTGGSPTLGLIGTCSGSWIEYHVAFGPNDNLRVSEIWDSREQLEEFGKRLMPLLAGIGIDPGEPELLEIHNIVKRWVARFARSFR
jgi:hypothetical protein